MERKFLRYVTVLVIFFVGLSLGVNYRENNREQQIQDQLNDFEKDITNPNNRYPDDFTPINPTNPPTGSAKYQKTVQNNGFTSLAKDGEKLIKKGIDLIFRKSGDFFRVIFD